MGPLVNDIAWDAPPGVRSAIDGFRRYVVQESLERKERWRQARPLMERIALELHGLGTSERDSAVRLKPVAAALHVTVLLRETISPGREGELRPIAGGFEATVFGQTRRQREASVHLWGTSQACDEYPRPESALNGRGRMTLAHEIGHTFFYGSDHREAKPARVVPAPLVGSRAYWREEGLCSSFAAALLMGSSVRAGLETPNMSSIVRLSAQCHVGPEVVVRRVLYDWHLWASTVICRVNWGAGSPRVALFLGEGRKRHPGISAADLEKSLETCCGPKEIVETLVQTKKVPERQISVGQQSVWVLLCE